METTFIKEFINYVHPKTLYPKAHKAFTALFYSNNTKLEPKNCKNRYRVVQIWRRDCLPKMS